MQVRLGLPSSFRLFAEAARELGAPVLVSANAFRRGRTGTFRVPPAGLFGGVPVALDSAGFVALTRYRGYPWGPSEYVRLAAGYPWDWWAQMDLCCEPEVAGDRAGVRYRQEETARLLRVCRAEAVRRGISPPMPVLQGWRPDDYARSAELAGGLPPLVGVGSVCRRNLGGEVGLLAVLERLDRELPGGVRLHLFGVKGSAVGRLAGHPRVHSVDSMAWDLEARHRAYRLGKPKTTALRATVMRSWYRRQIETLPQQAQGRDPPKDAGARDRQRRARARKRDGGLRQTNLWLPKEALVWIDAQSREGEDRSACVTRLIAEANLTVRD